MKNGPEHAKIAEGAGEDDGALALTEVGLRQSLRHEDPPAGFADRVMARAIAGDRPRFTEAAPDAEKSGRVLPWPVRPLWMRGAIAAALLLGLFEGGAAFKRVHEQQQRIAQATAQFQTTERVTVHALAQAREQLQKAGVPLTLD